MSKLQKYLEVVQEEKDNIDIKSATLIKSGRLPLGTKINFKIFSDENILNKVFSGVVYESDNESYVVYKKRYYALYFLKGIGRFINLDNGVSTDKKPTKHSSSDKKAFGWSVGHKRGRGW